MPDFDRIWAEHVKPLEGSTIRGFNGLENRIIGVDANGVVRVSRTGRQSRIPIEPFRWAVDRVLRGEAVRRQQINEAFPHRYSSGVQLVLEQVPLFDVSGRPATIRLRSE